MTYFVIRNVRLFPNKLTENRSRRLCCDSVGFKDWSPIRNSLAADRHLIQINIISKYQPKIIREDTEEKLEVYRLVIFFVASSFFISHQTKKQL